MTNLAKRNRELDNLRGIAIFLVLLEHFPQLNPWFLELPTVVSRGWSGVQLFFVISGYIVCSRLFPELQLARETEQPFRAACLILKKFFTKRATRVMAPCLAWFAITAIFSLSCEPGLFGVNLRQIALSLLVFSTNLFNEVYVINQGLTLPWHWSLAVEEQFYLAIPFVFWAIKKPQDRFKYALLFIGLVEFAVRPLLSFTLGVPALRFSTIPSFSYLIAGAVLYLFTETPTYRQMEGVLKQIPAKVWFVLTSYLALMLLFMPSLISDQNSVLYTAILLIAAALVGLASYGHGFTLPYLGKSLILNWMGTRSYSIYLSHFPVLTLHLAMWRQYAKVAGNIPLADESSVLLFGATAILSTVFFTELSYRLIELPFQRWGSRIASKFEDPKPLENNVLDLSQRVSASA